MKVLRNRLLVTLVFAAVVLTLGSSAALASLRSWSSDGTSVTQVDRPAATPSSGEPDVGGIGSQTPSAKGLRPVAYGWENPYLGTWWTKISRIWASWSLRGVR
jgi:hypothetical protein